MIPYSVRNTYTVDADERLTVRSLPWLQVASDAPLNAKNASAAWSTASNSGE